MVNTIWLAVHHDSVLLDKTYWLKNIREIAHSMLQSSEKLGPYLSILHSAAHSDLSKYRRTVVTHTNIATVILGVVKILIRILSPGVQNITATTPAERLIDQAMAFFGRSQLHGMWYIRAAIELVVERCD
jgi:hypothetical protein